MSTSTITKTITMNGNSTGYGAVSGNEIFNLAGYSNTVLLAGANDTVNIQSGLFDSIDLNHSGFTNSVNDSINLGTSAMGRVTTSHDLYNSTVSIFASSGPNMVSLLNHGGSTSVYLGYEGDPALQGSAYGNKVTLNGDATNTVNLTAGGYATVAIGTQNDGFINSTSNVTLTGQSNTLIGGDEAFTIANATSTSNTIALGNGNSTITLTGTANSLSLGNGVNQVDFMGGVNTATFGGGSNLVDTNAGYTTLNYAGGNAGSEDTINMNSGGAFVRGGDECFAINGIAPNTHLVAILGNGNDTIDMKHGSARVVLGTSTANTANNIVTMEHGGANVTLNGGVDIVSLQNSHLPGSDKVMLNGTLLGTQLSLPGAFANVILTNDANAVINDTGMNSGLNLTLNADATQGFGTIAINGLAQDDLAQIHLIGASAYTTTTDDTAAGGITLHFAHGTVDLIGLQSVPNHLFGG